MRKIFDQAMLGNLKLKNRMIRSATWEALADKAGHMNEELFTVYEDLAAGGFFLSRFISPAYNHRTDEYGGNSANCGRIVVEILRGIKKEYPDLHVTMKINCNDFMQGGLTPKDSMTICRLCTDAGMDSIEVSGNGTSATNIHAGKIEFLSLSRPLIREPNLPNRWQSGDTAPAKCISCNMCYRTPGHGCVFKR